VKRLNLGASRLERLPLKYIHMMNNSSWIHLGDPLISWKERFKNEFKSKNWLFCARILYRAFNPVYSEEQVNSFYSNADFREFYFKKGEHLEFEDDTFDFIYSEHVLEHMFLDEAFDLLQECQRILKPNGVIRIVVPDPDLRTYEKREPLSQLPIAHPEAHKTRWSIYSLPLAIETAGLQPNPLMYCDKYGQFYKILPTDDIYKQSIDKEFVYSFDYIQRLPSLIVDGIKTSNSQS
jgi:predicted SAM-dependent methyltransferase